MVKHWGEFLEIDHRHGEDILIKFMRVINLIGWVLSFYSLFLLEMAKPGKKSFIRQSGRSQLPQPWTTNTGFHYLF
ncbi:MAG: hypothetical protein KAR38_14800 [Calditrichia bacterium]|nr:hypothetical protein [Calditrichia bacterium]